MEKDCHSMDLRIIPLLLFVIIAGGIASSQNTGKTVRKYREPVEDPVRTVEVMRAELAMDRKDYPAAEKDLVVATQKDTKNYRAWFDLGFVYNETNRQTEAIDAYRHSVDANPEVFESTLNLGLMLARTGDPLAETYLRDATKLKPTAHEEVGWYRAWLSLGRVLEKTKPEEALEAYRNAGKLNPVAADPHLAAGILLDRQQNFTESAVEYKLAAERDPKSNEALAGLVNAYTRLKQYDQAEGALRSYMALDPSNATAHIQLGRLLSAQKKWDEATAELEKGLKAQPGDATAEKELAGIYMAQKQYDEATPHLQASLKSKPNNPEAHHWLGIALLNQKKFPEAQNEFVTALKLKPDYGDAYGDLALAASANKNYVLTLQALDARAKYLPENPATYFLRATTLDSMQDYKQAAVNYKQFLAVADGRYPDEEWKAKHRLIAIEPKK